jgi:hypothetical protein
MFAAALWLLRLGIVPTTFSLAAAGAVRSMSASVIAMTHRGTVGLSEMPTKTSARLPI